MQETQLTASHRLLATLAWPLRPARPAGRQPRLATVPGGSPRHWSKPST